MLNCWTLKTSVVFRTPQPVKIPQPVMSILGHVTKGDPHNRLWSPPMWCARHGLGTDNENDFVATRTGRTQSATNLLSVILTSRSLLKRVYGNLIVRCYNEKLALKLFILPLHLWLWGSLVESVSWRNGNSRSITRVWFWILDCLELPSRFKNVGKLTLSSLKHIRTVTLNPKVTTISKHSHTR